MHEMALCEGLIQALEEQARAQDFARVHKVFLEIGALATIEPDAMRFNFPIVAKGTLAEGAALEIDFMDASAWCMACSRRVAVKRHGEGCPACGSYQLQILDGAQMRIKQLEVS
ncbi:hydrogenase maturation nickel metallochaperone HypA [Acidocella sp.]|uniref:hydrogenase maturation nickel metallochaperone HypA n=1 Tax=Acidocella sp. TaxID=50710 RepID=UPI0026082F95|nr:hydrogenase maturation nickel metallochaperone HypA [Acidocella sp.]